MSAKQYRFAKLAVVVIVAAVVGQAIVYRSYLVPVAVLVAAVLVLLFLRRRVKEIVADERDFAIGGRAAFLAIQIYSWIAVIATLMFYAFRDRNPAYEAIGLTLAFSTCLLMLVYAALVSYHSRYASSGRKRTMLIVLVIALFIAMFAVGVRFLSGEDDWICVNGQWTAHGHPAAPAPTAPCGRS